MREDDAKSTINAIEQIKGVVDVSPMIANSDTWAAEAKGRHKIVIELYEFIKKNSLFEG